MRIAFYANGYSASVAANRLRMLQPMDYLTANGCDASLFSPDRGIEGYDAFIISRAHTRQSVAFAGTVRAAGRPLAYDVCDNLFEGYKSWHDRYRAPLFADMLRLADLVTTPTPVLGDLLKRHVPDATARFEVIPDALEELPAGDPGELGRLRRFLARNPGALHCVWFGSSTKNLAGLSHLDKAVEAMTAFSRLHPVTLTIISDTRWQYLLSSRNWQIPSFFQPFSISNFQPALALHRTAIIPVVRNPYTIGKSINRPATALLAGLGVIADLIDSYEELRPYIELDDWQAGLAHQALGPDPRVPMAQAYLRTRYNPEAVGKYWLNLANSLNKRVPSA